MSNEHNPVIRNLGNTTSKASAITAMCAHCMGCTATHLEPSFRIEIRNCTAKQCPLYHVRPYCEGLKGPNNVSEIDLVG